jgi:hypothetical protein
MPRLERIKNSLEIALAAVASLLCGASFGWNYGVDNQVVYLLGSLRLVHPEILARDWFATSTTHYHPAFKYLAAGLMALNARGWAVGLAQTAVIGAGMMGLYWLIRSLVERRQALAAFLLLVTIATITRTRGACATYAFDFILQPSSLGSAAFFISVPFFVRGQWLASGIALAVSGLFHANYLILFFGSYALAHLGLGVRDRRELWHRASRQFLPPLAVLLLFAPMILATAGAKDAKIAQEIYTTIRAPHHFVIADRERDFLGFIGWHMLGLGAALPLAQNRRSPAARLVTLLFALLFVIWAGVGLSVVVQLRQATQLFPWRIAPHVEMLLTALACAGAARAIADPAFGRRYRSQSLVLVASGLGALCLHASVRDRATVPAIVLGVLGVVALVQIVAEGLRLGPERLLSRGRALWDRGGAWVALAGALVFFVVIIVPEVRAIRSRSNVYTGISRNEQELFAWMRANTPAEAVFLTPPDNENMRYHGQRPIVVDWKSNPIVPGEVLEWVQRLEDVTGRKLRGHRDLEGYASLDEARLGKLRERYGVEYVVVRRGREKELGGAKAVYSNAAFTVLDVRR